MAVAAPRARPVAGPSTAPAPVRVRQVPRAATQARPAPRARLTRGVVWIALVAALLAGIVALNVAVLELRMERGRLKSEIVELGAQNAELEARLSDAASLGRIEAAARRLGLVEATDVAYLRLDPRR